MALEGELIGFRRRLSACVDLIHIDPPFNSNSNYEVIWGETKEGKDVRHLPFPVQRPQRKASDL